MFVYISFLIIPLFFYFAGIRNGQPGRSKMDKMMLTMGGSMLLGFSSGIYIAGSASSFFAAVVFSIFLTAIAGILLGAPHGGAAVAEGMFTGAMAGLMGAMTADMLSLPEKRVLLLLFLLLTSLGGLWVLKYWKIGVEFSSTKSKAMIFNFFTFIYLLFVAYIFIIHPPFTEEEPNHETDHHTIFIWGNL
ncbi:hypothetical protein MM300_12065 [Evansella sp. LMS18]|jgi:preprotein translocase subunit YajC|uniref:hypothetical protein n=1 Tax=Evansella sp. LMS18 TaxID=2924033 RepID=UPI0020D07A40|nr:hypothetical protein [Evansella sp. LMS18]UTR08694.1 hypothetical protein MM300_12065 [Evansella sp. LMS18]